MNLKEVVLAPNYPDLWRKKYFYPAIAEGKSIALIGIGDIENYINYNWKQVDFKGFDALYLHNHSKDYRVYDIDEHTVVSAAKHGINASSHDLCNAPLPRKYDYVFAADVIEHTESPLRFLKNVSQSLRQGGIGCITTPNADYWRNAIPWRLSENPTHLQAFTMRHLNNLIRLLSLETVVLKSFPTSSPFIETYRPATYLFHKLAGRILSYNSLLFVFKQNKI